MGDIRNKADNVYRDFAMAGVTASGRNEPTKADIRELMKAVDVAVYTAQAGISTVADIAARDAFFADEANQAKLVYVNNNNAAADDPANGVYEYVGGVRLAEGYYQGLASAVQPLVDQVAAAADSLDNALTNLTEAAYIGRADTPVDGSSGSANTRYFNDPAPYDCIVDQVELFSSLTGTNTATLKIKVADRDAGPDALVSGDAITGTNAATLTITGGGLKVFDVNFPLSAGQFSGWYHSVAGAVDFKPATPSDSGGFWSDTGAVGDNLAMTVNSKVTNAQWQIRFRTRRQIVTKDTERKADAAYSTVGEWLGKRLRPIPAIAADIDWAMCLSADFITPGQEVGDSNELREWLDRSGNGNSPATVVPDIDTFRPVYDPDAFGAGIPGVQFVGDVDGTGDARVMYLQLTMKLAQPFTVVAIVQIPALNTAQLTLFDSYAYTTGSDPANRASLGLAIGGKPYIGIGSAMTVASPTAISAGAAHLIIGTFNGASSSIMVDGVSKATGAITGGLDGMVLGSGQADVRRWNGAVGMLGFANGTLSADEIAAIEAYAAARYAVVI